MLQIDLHSLTYVFTIYIYLFDFNTEQNMTGDSLQDELSERASREKLLNHWPHLVLKDIEPIKTKDLN